MVRAYRKGGFDMDWLKLPRKIYFKPGSMPVALAELSEVYGFSRAFIVTDSNLYRLGMAHPVDRLVSSIGLRTAEFFIREGTPSCDDILGGMPKINEFAPDVIIGVGGSSVMSLARCLWLLYENPETDLNEISERFSGISEGDALFPEMGNKAKLVLVATTAGRGAECSPFAVFKDDKGKKRVIASYSLLPEIAVIDPDFSAEIPPDLTKKGGLQILSQAVRAYVSDGSTDYTKGLAAEAVQNVFAYLPEAVQKGSAAPLAREHLAYAAALAGMAYGNSVQTIGQDEEVYPSAHESSMGSSGPEVVRRTADLAGRAGFEGDESLVFEKWIDACKGLSTL